MVREIIDGECHRVDDDDDTQTAEYWERRLKDAQAKLKKRTLPAFFEFCEDVHAYRVARENDKVQGGTSFTRDGTAWLGCAKQSLYRWDAVGRRAPELVGMPTCLLTGEDEICRIASLDDVSFRKALPRLRADMPRKEVRNLIKEVKPAPPEPTAAELEEKIEKKRRRLYKAFMDLPEKHQFILGRGICSHLEAKGWKP